MWVAEDLVALQALGLGLVLACAIAFGAGPFDRWLERRARR